MFDKEGAQGTVGIGRVIELLGELSDELPDEVFKELNLGVIVLEEERLHWDSKPEYPLYLLGLYTKNNMGRQITIYYGSVMRVYGHLPEARLKDRLREILRHELLHHLENLGGEFGLEFEDHLNMQDYRETLRHLKDPDE